MDMQPELALTLIDREGRRMLEVATSPQATLTSPVAACPGWDLEQLVLHLARVYNRAGTIVAGRLLAPPEPGEMPARPDGTPATDWLASRHERLLGALRDASESDLVWNFTSPSPQPAAFWFRRQVHETVIHRADAELAVGRPISPLEPEIAADNVDEFLTLTGHAGVTHGDPPGTPSRAGEAVLPASVHLHATDFDGAEWTVDTSRRTFTRHHAKGDVAVRGPAWALALWCWGRPSADPIEVFGDVALAETWRSGIAR